MRLGGTDAYPESTLSHAHRWFDLLESMAENALDPDALLTKTADLYAQDCQPFSSPSLDHSQVQRAGVYPRSAAKPWSRRPTPRKPTCYFGGQQKTAC